MINLLGGRIGGVPQPLEISTFGIPVREAGRVNNVFIGQNLALEPEQLRYP